VKYFAFAPERPASAPDRVSIPPELGPRRTSTIVMLAVASCLFGYLNFVHEPVRTHDETVNVVMAEDKNAK